jgi:hypothetical protein
MIAKILVAVCLAALPTQKDTYEKKLDQKSTAKKVDQNSTDVTKPENWEDATMPHVQFSNGVIALFPNHARRWTARYQAKSYLGVDVSVDVIPRADDFDPGGDTAKGGLVFDAVDNRYFAVYVSSEGGWYYVEQVRNDQHFYITAQQMHDVAIKPKEISGGQNTLRVSGGPEVYTIFINGQRVFGFDRVKWDERFLSGGMVGALAFSGGLVGVSAEGKEVQFKNLRVKERPYP